MTDASCDVLAPTRDTPERMPTLRAQDLGGAADGLRGEGIPPDNCDVLVHRGWVEWVDFASGLPTDENSPRALLQMTPQGRTCLEASAAQLAST